MLNKINRWIYYVLLILSPALFAHENQHKKIIIDEEKLKQINLDYLKTAKPIFNKKCLDCHGKPMHYPWYYRISWAKKVIDRDIQEAKKHLDILDGFPFRGHGSPLEDLEAIEKSIKKATMPPFRYRMMHWNAGITTKEKKEILEWIQRSKTKLQ